MTDTTARQGFREWLRTTFETPVKLQFGESQMLEAKTLNLAQGGMFVPMKQPKPVGTLVRFELELPDSRASVAGFGEVVWLRVRNEGPELPPGVGIQFRYLSDVDRQRIREVAQLIVADATKREAAAEAAALAAATPRPAMATASRAATGAPVDPEAWRAALTHPTPVPDDLPDLPDVTDLPEMPPLSELVPAGPAPVPGALVPPPRPSPQPGQAAVPSPRPAPQPARSAEPPPAAAARPALFSSHVKSEKAGRGRTYRLLGLAVLALAALGVSLWLRSRLASPPPTPARSAAQRSTGPKPKPAPAPAAPAQTSEAGAVDATAAAPAPAPPPAPPFRQLLAVEVLDEAGSTVVRLKLDGSPQAERLISSRINSGPPRQLLQLSGVTIPLDPAYLLVRGPRVARVRTGLHDEVAPPELHVVVDLAHPNVELAGIELEPTAIKLTFTGG